MKRNNTAICRKGVWDDSVPAIKYDAEGVSNYAKLQEKLMKDFPRGDAGKAAWEKLVSQIKEKGKGKRYDCIIGVSGGTDSSYLMHIAKEYGLRPLAVNVDNGWNSDISVRNIKRMTTQLDVDLETYVIDYEEMKSILRSYILAGLPWIDSPTDIAIKATLFKIANTEKVPFILNGHDFRTEGKQPIEWTYSDSRQIKYVFEKFSGGKLRTFPTITPFQLFYFSYVKKIRMIRPFFHIDYNKEQAKKFLTEKYGWEYYGGHHHENIFTKFTISYWLPKKFSIDKRKITLSALILSGEISREQAISELQKPPYDPDLMEKDKMYVIKKLDFEPAEFDRIFCTANHSFLDYPSYYPLMRRFISILRPFLEKLLGARPILFYEIDMRRLAV